MNTVYVAGLAVINDIKFVTAFHAWLNSHIMKISSAKSWFKKLNWKNMFKINIFGDPALVIM